MDGPVDHAYTQMDKELGIQMYWSNPATVVQGNMNGFISARRRAARNWRHYGSSNYASSCNGCGGSIFTGFFSERER